MKIRCRDCSYHAEKNSLPEKCPYCGSKGIMKEQEAGELLDEIESEEEVKF